MNGITITLFFGTSFFILVTSFAVDTITANQTVNDTTTIESAHGNFELGFFSPGSSKNRYVGIWYKKISKRTIVWVANRQIPLTDASGVLRINANGSLVLADGASRQIWSSNSSRTAANNNSVVVVVQLLDSGNLVIRYENDVDPDNYLWQSFDHLADNFLPGMKLGWDLVTGLSRNLTSWRSDDDPSIGDFTFAINRDGYPRMLLYKNSTVQFRYGPWDGVQFNGVDFSVPESSFQVIPVSNEKELYYTYNLMNNSVVMRMFVHPNGSAQFLTWNNQSESWENSLTPQKDVCDQYATCGANASCDNRNSGRVNELCGCLEGYVPAFPEKWRSANWSDGCTLKTNFSCGGDKFVRYSGWKLPDTQHSWFNNDMNLDDCKNMCLTNCSCTAYSNVDIRQDGTGCLLWFGALIDIRDYSGAGLDFYVRIAASELEVKRSSRTKKGLLIAVVTVLGSMLVLLGLLLLKKRMQRRKGILEFTTENEVPYENESEDLELPLFDFFAIANATNNFSANNKLGEGGFGAVYKGVLDDGKYIAVKRLSKDSRQGANEFKTEVSLIAKLQHRNLVRLLGCCIREGEMLLIYEYMPNKSLDSLLFANAKESNMTNCIEILIDQELSKSLDWPKRYNIINGIARGLLYLHQDSRLRIIHRDLKPSNILLDNEMNPRISDFGMAKSFIGSETEANTTRVVGTLGYMSPEYALDGTFSVKSDVYSFGVLVLEIVSGKKMRHFYDSNESLNLLNYAWKLYTEDKFSELIDGAIKNSYNQLEAFRSIQIALLCVDANPDYRPSMAHVVSMMTSEAELPNPKQPEFYTRLHTTRQPATGLSTSNMLTVSFIGPR